MALALGRNSVQEAAAELGNLMHKAAYRLPRGHPIARQRTGIAPRQAEAGWQWPVRMSSIVLIPPPAQKKSHHPLPTPQPTHSTMLAR